MRALHRVARRMFIYAPFKYYKSLWEICQTWKSWRLNYKIHFVANCWCEELILKWDVHSTREHFTLILKEIRQVKRKHIWEAVWRFHQTDHNHRQLNWLNNPPQVRASPYRVTCFCFFAVCCCSSLFFLQRNLLWRLKAGRWVRTSLRRPFNVTHWIFVPSASFVDILKVNSFYTEENTKC